jgi:hypothetical protein
MSSLVADMPVATSEIILFLCWPHLHLVTFTALRGKRLVIPVHSQLVRSVQFLSFADMNGYLPREFDGKFEYEYPFDERVSESFRARPLL